MFRVICFVLFLIFDFTAPFKDFKIDQPYVGLTRSGLISAAGKARLLDESRAIFLEARASGIASPFLFNAYMDSCAR